MTALEQLKSIRFFPKFLSGQNLRKGEYQPQWKILVVRTVRHLFQQERPRLAVIGLLAVGLLGGC